MVVSDTLYRYMNDCIEEYLRRGKQQTAASYTSALKQFSLFMKGKDVRLCELNSDIINGFKEYLVCNKVSHNTIAYYMSALRAVYNRAVKQNIVKNSFPFMEISTRVKPVEIKALSEEELERLRDLDLSQKQPLAFARDMFMLSFYMRGMSYGILAGLRMSDIEDGFITCDKRGVEPIVVKIEPCIREIIDRYSHKTVGTDYLLPIVVGTDRGSNEYTSSVRLLNARLKKIVQILGFDLSLTSAVARHTWASIALKKGVSKQTISRCLGYNTEELTRKYLRNLEQSLIDNASKLVIL